MRVSATILIVCFAIYATCALITEPPERRMWVAIPGLIGFFVAVLSSICLAVCAIWGIE